MVTALQASQQITDSQSPKRIIQPTYSGIDVAGEVVEVGPGVKSFKAGDKVVAAIRPAETKDNRDLRIRALFDFFDAANLGYLDYP
ncbi:hypothetical protein SO802_022654 [Lithocarpus litseifolius]|uniref:Alcohol dehydrogenase-like N-terminal domain-containing protein n=1 Tax=Lithocarpus litseifolius TaxID=425828 RepID=A0AAW2C5J0_9ROSI